MAERFEHARFLENLNSKFRLAFEGGEGFDLELIGISDLKTGPQQESFSIFFCCPDERILPQRIYPLEHEVMGKLELFLVPIKKDEQGVHYEAVFNRILEKAEVSGSSS